MSRKQETLRLDIWLNVACLFKTRSQAKLACQKGRVLVNGHSSRAHHVVRLEDRVEIRYTGWQRLLIVKGLLDKSVSKAQARLLFEDVSPPRPRLDTIDRILQAQPSSREPGQGRPTKRQRREIDRLRDRVSRNARSY